MHWKVGRVNCTFKVRVRRGWADLRAFLAEVRAGSWRCALCCFACSRLSACCCASSPDFCCSKPGAMPQAWCNSCCPQNADRFEVFVCSKGKREYIQLLWLMLDPAGQLIPQQGEHRSGGSSARIGFRGVGQAASVAHSCPRLPHRSCMRCPPALPGLRLLKWSRPPLVLHRLGRAADLHLPGHAGPGAPPPAPAAAPAPCKQPVQALWLPRDAWLPTLLCAAAAARRLASPPPRSCPPTAPSRRALSAHRPPTRRR